MMRSVKFYCFRKKHGEKMTVEGLGWLFFWLLLLLFCFVVVFLGGGGIYYGSMWLGLVVAF